MQVSVRLFTAIAGGYAASCGVWLAAQRFLPGFPPREPPCYESDRPWLDLFLAILAVAGVLGLGQAYRAGWLIPASSPQWSWLAYNANAMIWYLPIVVILVIRRQPTSTVFLSNHGVAKKLLSGLAAAAIGLAVYLLAMGQFEQFPVVTRDCVSGQSVRHLLPVFLEAAAIVFLFIRLRWIGGSLLAVLLPSLLFAAAHIPRGLASGDSIAHIGAFFCLTFAISVFVLMVLNRSRDIIWLGVVHYVMDIAIGAFD